MSEEATERVVISVSSEISKPKHLVERNSTGRIKTRTSPSFVEGDEKPVPHYLKTPTGSCHDFCKYGIKHDVEVKKRRPIRQRFFASKEMTVDENDQVNVATQGERRKKGNVKPVVSQQKDQGVKNALVINQGDPPPEKIIQLSDSPTNAAEGSAKGSSNMNQVTDAFFEHLPANQADRSSEELTSIKLVTPSSILAIDKSDEHKSTNSSEGLPEMPESIKLVLTATDNSNGSSELAPTEGSSAEPVTTKDIVSSSIQHSSASALHSILNLPGGILEDPLRTELMDTFTVKEDTASAEHVTSCGSDISPAEMIELTRSSDLPSSMTPKKHKDETSARNGLANGAEGCTEEDSSAKQKTRLSAASAIGSPVYQEEGLSKKEKQVNSSNTGGKAKRDTSKLKKAKKIVDVSDSLKVVIRQAKIDLSRDPIDKKKTVTIARKSISSVKPETKQKINNIEPVTPGVVKKKALSAGKNVGASAECAIPIKIKNFSSKTTSHLTFSEGLARRNHEKIIKVPNQSDRGKKKVPGQSLSSLSMKSHTSRISTTKLWIYRSVNPASQVKNRTMARKLGSKKEISHVSEPKPEKINLKTIMQNPRKHKSVLSDGKDHDSRSKLGEASKSVLQKEAKHSTSSVVSKGEIYRKPRTTASVHSEDKSPAAHRLKFSRGKVITLQHENNAPRMLRFRKARTASDNQNARGDVGKKAYRSRTGPSGADTDTSTSISKTPTVVLRHQDVQEKKDPQGLLNHVIEETASKLVEIRKSKVKALVGAFETVISLQESKVAPL